MSNDKIESLRDKIRELNIELQQEILKVIGNALSPLFTSLLAEYKITGEVAVITWDVEEEYDDEGGTYFYPYNICLQVDGEFIDTDECETRRPDRYRKHELSDCYLDDDLRDVINGFKNQLVDSSESGQITIKIGGQN